MNTENTTQHITLEYALTHFLVTKQNKKAVAAELLKSKDTCGRIYLADVCDRLGIKVLMKGHKHSKVEYVALTIARNARWVQDGVESFGLKK